MKQKLLKSLMLIAVLLTSNAVRAYDFESGGIYYNILSEEEKTLEVTYRDTDYNSYTGEVVIPSTVTLGENSYTVTSIGDRAFYVDHSYYGGESLTYIELPSTITSIGISAFYSYEYITRTIKCNAKTPPTTRGYETFYNNDITLEVPFESVLAYAANTDWNPSTQEYMPYYSITYQPKEVDGMYYLPISETEVGVRSNPSKYTGEVIIPNEITVNNKKYKVTSIGSAFSGCTVLTSVTIPESVTSIGHSAFSGCTGLTSVTIPEGVTSIGSSAFSGCTVLTSVTIPEGVTSIGSSAFSGCTGLITITIPESVTNIGGSAFYGTAWYNNLSDGVIYINNILYKYKGTMPENTSISIKEGTISISGSAFMGCAGLTSITIPEGVTSIGASAFSSCISLTYIEFPSTIASIGSQAFYHDYNNNYNYITRTIKCNAKTPPTLGSNAFTCDVFCYNYLTIEVPLESFFTYKTVEGWSKIADDFFGESSRNITYKSSEVDGIYYLPTSETEVAVAANPSKYTGNVTIPVEINAGEKTFKVTSIDNSAFDSCTGLTSITIPEGVTTIGDMAFIYCTGLTNIELPSTITSIGTSAFYHDYYYNNNYNYITRTIKCNAKTPPTLGSDVFTYNNLTIEVPFESVLAYQAVEGWTKINDDSWSDSSRDITYKPKEVDGIYYMPTAATEVAVTYKIYDPNSAEWYISDYISDVVIPAEIPVDNKNYKVTSIGNFAFYFCKNLTSFTLPNTVTSIGDYAFYNCSKLNGKLSIPSSVTSIGSSAFYGTNYSICDIETTTPPTITSSSLSSGTSLVLVPEGTVDTYKADEVWSAYTIIAEGSCDIEVTNETGGDLAKSILTQTRKNLNNITGLTVHGSLNSIDLELINSNMTSLLHLDITDTDVTEIPAEAFKDIVTLMSVKLPTGLQTIGDYAFSGCKVLSGELLLPEKLVKIGNYAFQNCSNLSGTLKIPANVTNISSYAFSGCVSVNSIDMTEATKLYELGANAFSGCTSIESVDMAGAGRLINLSSYIFSGCTGLKSVDMTGAKSLTSLSSYLFNGCTSLETVLLPETLQTIGSYSFYNCTNLESLKLPAALKTIESTALNSCNGLKSIDMTEAKSMTSLSSSLFSGLYSLETVLFPETMETIGSYSFNNCTKLNNVKLPAALKTIDSSAFYGCIGLTIIDFSACTSLNTIYDSAFYGCTTLSMLDLSACESLITINSSAFSGCITLETINFPSSLVSIGNKAFANCTNLLQMSVPCTVPPVIENNAEPFSGVDNIACVLSIPTDNFFDYYSANYWGGFVDVESKGEIQNEVNNPTDGEGTEEGDNTDSGDSTDENKNRGNGCHIHFKKHRNEGNTPRTMSLKGINTLATTESVMEISDMGLTGDGQSVFAEFGESVTFYLTPEEGKEIESVYFNDEDVTSQLVNNTYTVTLTSDMTMTNFVVNLKNAASVLLGDVNGDGEVNVTDIMSLANYILGKNSDNFVIEAADVNSDGNINVTDIMSLANIILGTNQ